MKTVYKLEKTELDEFIYFQTLGCTAYKFHYLKICFTVPFFLLLTYECFDHLQTGFGKLILTLLSIAWLIRGSDWFWKSKIHRFVENRNLPNPLLKKEISFQFDSDLLLDQKSIQSIKEFHCLQSCMILNCEDQIYLIPWRIFKNDETKGQFVRSCLKKKTSTLNYSHKEA